LLLLMLKVGVCLVVVAADAQGRCVLAGRCCC